MEKATGSTEPDRPEWAQFKRHVAAWWKINPVEVMAALYHVTHRGEPLNFVDNPCLKMIYGDFASRKTIMKATQVGVTEYLVCYSITHAMLGRSIFYVLPTYGLVGRYVKNRVDRTVARTAEYRDAVRVDNKRASESMTLKHFGNGAIAYVGSNSTVGFTEYPADILVVDEVDECDPDNLNMAWERLSASTLRWQVKVGNPTITGRGISAEWESSTKHRWHIACPACGREQAPEFFTHVVRQEAPGMYRVRDPEWAPGATRDVRLICERCESPMERKADGRWIPEVTGKENHGYHISKLFAGETTLAELLQRLEDGTRSDTALARFYNGDLGLPYVAQGARITEEMIDAARGGHSLGERGSGMPIIGIDVGTTFHILVGFLEASGKVRVSHIGESRDLRELMELLRDWKVRVGVIDAMPERRISRMVTKRQGMFACWYQEGKRDLVQGENVAVDRTSALDQAKEALLTGGVILPQDARRVPGLYAQLTSSTRLFDPAAKGGRGAWRWDEGGQADHYFHALGYLMIARSLAAHAGSGGLRMTTVAGTIQGSEE